MRQMDEKKSKFDLYSFYDAEFKEHQEIYDKTITVLKEPFAKLVDICTDAIRSGNKIFFFGNGGSASDAQHLATELTIRYVKDRAPIAALSLATDTSALTAAGNDIGFEHLFSRQIQALGRARDVAVGISTSGKSPNVLYALKEARKMGLKTVGLTGRDGGSMPEVSDVALIIPSDTTSRIQEMHILLGHILCGALEQNLGLV